MSKLIRYSKLHEKRNMKFLKKKYIESNYSILYDVGCGNELINHKLLGDIENLIIDKNTEFIVQLSDIQAKNIYFENELNLGGVTIPFKIINESNRGFYFNWSNEYPSNINKINIVFDNDDKTINIKTINVNNPGKINFKRTDYSDDIYINIRDDKKLIAYIIDDLGNIKELKIDYYLTKNDIKDNKIDLSEFIDYKKIHVDVDNDIKVNEIIINKKCLKELHKLHAAISYIHYDKLKIIDDNDMRLNPIITEIKGNNRTIEVYQDYSNKFYIYVKQKEQLIYIDELNNIKILDKEKLLKNKNIEKYDFYLEDNFHIGKHCPLTIIKYKNNKTKIGEYNEVIEIGRLFNEFNLLNIYKYYHHDREEINNLLINNDWYTLFNKRYIDWYHLKDIYQDYLKFLNHIKKLHNLGFSYKGIKYIYEKHYDNLTNTKEFNNVDNLKYQNSFNVYDMTKEEINLFNELGKNYLKRLNKK